MMMKVWKWYQTCLFHRPLKTQAISSSVFWGVGDLAEQYITHCTTRNRLQLTHDKAEDFKVDWRDGVASILGFGIFGPVGHFWFEKLDKFTKFRLRLSPNSVRFVAAKVKEEYKRDFMKRKLKGDSDSGLGLIAQIVNFRYVPVRYQLLYQNMILLLDGAFNSWATNSA